MAKKIIPLATVTYGVNEGTDEKPKIKEKVFPAGQECTIPDDDEAQRLLDTGQALPADVDPTELRATDENDEHSTDAGVKQAVLQKQQRDAELIAQARAAAAEGTGPAVRLGDLPPEQAKGRIEQNPDVARKQVEEKTTQATETTKAQGQAQKAQGAQVVKK